MVLLEKSSILPDEKYCQISDMYFTHQTNGANGNHEISAIRSNHNDIYKHIFLTTRGN